MPTYVALLRGINLGSHNKVAMPALRAAVEGLGFQDVATYIQSGNVLFSSDQADTAQLAADLERAMADRLGETAVAACGAARVIGCARKVGQRAHDLLRDAAVDRVQRVLDEGIPWPHVHHCTWIVTSSKGCQAP